MGTTLLLSLLLAPVPLTSDEAIETMRHVGTSPAPRMVLLETGEPEEIFIDDPVAGRRAWWVIPFRLTNPTGQDRMVALRVFAELDVPDLEARERIEAATPVRPMDAIERVEDLADRFPSPPLRMEPVDQVDVEALWTARTGREALPFSRMQGRLRAGQVKEGLAVFPRLHDDCDRVDVYFDGLSGVRFVERSGEDYKQMLRSGYDVRVVESDPILERDGYRSPVAELTIRQYEELRDREMAQVAGGSQDEVMKLADSDILIIPQQRDEARDERYYFLGGSAFLSGREPEPVRERWITYIRYHRRGDRLERDIDEVDLVGRFWFLAVEKVD